MQIGLQQKKGICYCSCQVVCDFLKFCSYYVPKSLIQPLAQAKNGDEQFWK
jgi:hypothetical protein